MSDGAPSIAMPLVDAVAKGFIPFIVAGLGVLLVIRALRLATPSRGSRGSFGVRRKTFMTPPERRMVALLEEALPEVRIHAQVAMGALLDPVASLKGPDRMRVRARFSQKIVDFVAEDRESGEIVALIELDDRTHLPARDQKRDAMTQEAGYRPVRFHRDQWPTQRDVRARVFPELTERQVRHVG